MTSQQLPRGEHFWWEGTATMDDHRNYLDLMITRSSAYELIDAEIKRRIKEGRTMRQLKPKRGYVVDNSEMLTALTLEKMKA
jgi:hypothetical protein